MNKNSPELLAAYWTLAGDVYPGAPTEVSSFSLQERAAAASKAGYTGMGLVHADLMATAAKMGFSGIKTVLADHGIKHVEVEFLGDWFFDPPIPGAKPLTRRVVSYLKPRLSWVRAISRSRRHCLMRRHPIFLCCKKSLCACAKRDARSAPTSSWK